ncbi:hypothetical protein DQP56_06835 [Mycolicibacter senuensis]|nr:hypothetical protein DQP56_06835 [Mycolicibacter senuensis]
MAVVEVIYLVAATLWILVVTAAVCVGGRYFLKLRARRRRINRLIGGVRLSIERAMGPYRAVARPVLGASRGRVVRGRG